MRITLERNHNIILLVSAYALLVIVSGANLFAQSGLVRVFSMNTESLLRSQREATSGNKAVLASVKRLQKDADKVLGLKLVSVMDKNVAAQSGDKHDYLSLSRYWWPDPAKPDGLPYILRDGETNPEISSISDQENMQQVLKSVHTLGLAYFFTRKEEYAERATEILKTWFLNADTKMNPNMNYGQIVKGKDVGRASGLIDVRGFAILVDGVGMLGGSRSWTDDNQKALVAWFTEYLHWLQTSKIGMQEAQSDNNHGVWFDVQRTSIALFVGKADLARSILQDAKAKRIAQQIEPDGTMPRELARTRSMHYTAFILEAFFNLALIGDQVGVDLWNYKTADGRSIRSALEWFLPFCTGEKEWTYKQIDEFKKEGFFQELLLATTKFGDGKFAEAGRKFAGDKAKTDRANLMFGN